MSSQTDTSKERRVGRVEKWLSKGFGFVIDLGKCDTNNSTTYGWVKDEMTGTKVFVYHSDLVAPAQDLFHRLYANEYVEYTIDHSLPKKNERFQGFEVTGLDGSKLLCELNNANAATGTQLPPQQQRRQRQRQPNATVVYYVPTSTTLPSTPIPTNFPALSATTNAEPSYVMPTSGIPVPK